MMNYLLIILLPWISMVFEWMGLFLKPRTRQYRMGLFMVAQIVQKTQETLDSQENSEKEVDIELVEIPDKFFSGRTAMEFKLFCPPLNTPG